MDKPRKVTAWAAVFLAAAAILVATPAQAHSNNNHGTIKVHDDAVMDPPTQNNPHVTCDFWIEGFDMTDDAGRLVFEAWEPTGNKTQVMEDRWTGIAEGDDAGYHFLAGPYQLPAGHYRVEAFVDTGHPGNVAHSAKSKMFWVDSCPTEPCVGDDCPPPVEERVCPTDLMATPMDDGAIHLTWTEAIGSNGTNVYRAVGDGELEYLATVSAGNAAYTDEDTEVGVTYTYSVRGLYGRGESVDCPVVTATTIPVFPSLLAAVGAVGIAAAGYVVVRRRK